MKTALVKKDSIFYTYKQLIELRKNNELIVWGDYQLVTDTPDDVFAYYRTLNNEQWLVVCNMSEKNQPYTLADQAMTLVISNYPQKQIPTGKLNLRPYEAFVLKTSK